MTIGALLFESPFALAALGSLPIIWWLLRFTPPRPTRVAFPPIRLLLGLINREETPHKSPWWLTALRMLIALLVILALAEPLYDPSRQATSGSGPLLVVVDDSWAAAPDWERRKETLETIAAGAERDGRPVALVMTTPRSSTQSIAFSAPDAIRQRIAGLEPRPFAPDRSATAAEIAKQTAENKPNQVIWLSDGLDYGGTSAFVEALASLSQSGAGLTVFRQPPAATPVVLDGPTPGDSGFAVQIRRADKSVPHTGSVRALAMNGRTLGDVAFTFEEDQLQTSAKFDIPLALRNQIGRMELTDARSAAGVFLLDDRWRRRPVGLVSGTSSELAQPLLSPLHYVARALEPFAQTTEAPATAESSGIETLLDQGQSVLIVADIGQFSARDEARIEEWIEEGGVLVRFAGPRLAANNDDLIPVRLRRGGRALGGALSWSKPQSLGPFDDSSPFRGLEKLASEVTVRRQVLAEPSSDLSGKTWARLQDGTPLVTAQARKEGLIVLFHVAASPDWSNLPLSGMFVEMLRKIVQLSTATVSKGEPGRSGRQKAQATLPPLRVLNGFGEFVAPPPDAVSLPSGKAAPQEPSPKHPPGLYGRDTRIQAVNTVSPDTPLEPLGASLGSANMASYETTPARALKREFLLVGFVLLMLDALAVLLLAGWFTRRGMSTAAGVTVAAMIAGTLLTALPAGVMAQEIEQNTSQGDDKGTAETKTSEEFALRASLSTHLAYVITGNRQVDDTSLAGMTGLTNVIARRTALEPGAPFGVNLERDDLTFFPFIYWPVLPDAQAVSAKGLAKVDAYMKNGGTILFDTRDHQQSLPSMSAIEAGPGTQSLRRILASLDIPALEVVPAGHVLTKAFYLLQSFPGRWSGGQLWVEANSDRSEDGRSASNFDGVSSIIISSNDFAAAWATDANGRAMFPVVPGGPRQREMALRSGVNMVIYSLTGNYKADQVHIPALLERLGQ